MPCRFAVAYFAVPKMICVLFDAPPWLARFYLAELMVQWMLSIRTRSERYQKNRDHAAGCEADAEFFHDNLIALFNPRRLCR